MGSSRVKSLEQEAVKQEAGRGRQDGHGVVWLEYSRCAAGDDIAVDKGRTAIDLDLLSGLRVGQRKRLGGIASAGSKYRHRVGKTFVTRWSTAARKIDAEREIVYVRVRWGRGIGDGVGEAVRPGRGLETAGLVQRLVCEEAIVCLEHIGILKPKVVATCILRSKLSCQRPHER